MSTTPIRVLSVSTSDFSGGAARAAYRIHQAVRNYGIDSKMFVKDKGTSDDYVIPLSDFVFHGAAYELFDWLRNKAKNKWQHYQWGRYPRRYPYFMSDLRSTDICGALRRIDYDILHLHWINLRFIPLDKLPKDKPIVWTLHDSWPFCGVCHLPMDCHRYEKECCYCPALGSERHHDLSHDIWVRKKGIYKDRDFHIVTPSHWLAECTRRSALFGDRDIHIIPNCLDMDLFCPGDRETACHRFHLDPKKKHILFGAMNALEDKNKGFDYLVKALEFMGIDNLKDTDLVVFGSSRCIADEIGGMRVFNMGVLKERDDLMNIYRVADTAVVPSLSENLSCTIMESLACGIPVVAFDIGGNRDLIAHQSNGYLAKEKEYEDFAQGIIWCLENNKEGELSTNAIRTVSEGFSPERVGSMYSSLYQSIMR